MPLPTYNDLLDDFYKDPNHALFRHKDLGCGMLRFTKVTLEEMLWNRRDGKVDLTTILVNTQNHKVYPLVDADGKIHGFSPDDICEPELYGFTYKDRAKDFIADGYANVLNYVDGFTEFAWSVYTDYYDSSYYADDDGFGGESDDLTLWSYIDTECRPVLKVYNRKYHNYDQDLYNEAWAKLKADGKIEGDKPRSCIDVSNLMRL